MDETAPSLVVAAAVEARVHPTHTETAPATSAPSPASSLPRGRRVGERDHVPSARDITPPLARRSEDPKPAAMVKMPNMTPVRLPLPPYASIRIDAPAAPKPVVKSAPSAPAPHKRSWVRDILLVIAAVTLALAVRYLKIF